MALPTISYSRDTLPGYPGMIATTEPHWITSNVVEAGSGDITPGRAVVYGATVDTVKAPTAGGKFAGVAVVDRTLPHAQGNVFKPYDQISTMKNGSIWVSTGVAVAFGDPVYFVNATGLFSNVAASGANTLVENAEFATSTSGAGLARVRLGVSK
jgi:hypothetical protein